MFVFLHIFRYNGKEKVWRLVKGICLNDQLNMIRKLMYRDVFVGMVLEICIVSRTMDADVYHYILERKMVRRAKKLFGTDVQIFQSDNNPKHTAGKINVI